LLRRRDPSAGAGRAGRARGHRPAVAQGILTIRAIETHAARRQPVDVGGFDDAVAVATEHGVQIVDHDEQDVGAGAGRGKRAAGVGRGNERQNRRQQTEERTEEKW